MNKSINYRRKDVFEFLYLLGSDVAGEVIEIGPGVKHVETGQRVFGMSRAFGGYSEELILDSFVS